MFTEKEIAYIQSQPLARIATVGADGQPDVTPVGAELVGAALYIGGHGMESTRKYKNIEAGRDQVALVFDDLLTITPWHPRGIRIYGHADLEEHDGRVGHGIYIRLTPHVSWSWNIEGPSVHKTVHAYGKGHDD